MYPPDILFLNHISSIYFYILIVSILRILFEERLVIKKLIKMQLKLKKNLEEIHPLLKSIKFVILGSLLVFVSYAFFNTIITYLNLGDVFSNSGEMMDTAAFLYPGFLTTTLAILMVFAGYFFMLSSGKGWLKNLGKSLLVIAFFYFLVVILNMTHQFYQQPIVKTPLP